MGLNLSVEELFANSLLIRSGYTLLSGLVFFEWPRQGLGVPNSGRKVMEQSISVEQPSKIIAGDSRLDR